MNLFFNDRIEETIYGGTDEWSRRWPSRFRIEAMIDSVENCFRHTCDSDLPSTAEMKLPWAGDRTTQC